MIQIDNLRVFLVETIPHYVFDSEEKVGTCPILINFIIRSICPDPITSFWTVTFSAYGSVCSEFFQTGTSETILKKKATVHFVNINLLFLFGACGQLSIQVHIMFMNTSLIEPYMWKLILNQLIGEITAQNSAMDLRMVTFSN